MKKIIIMELILAFSIFYLVKYVPNYKNTILVLKDDIKIERERGFIFIKEKHICKRNFKFKWYLGWKNLFL